MLLNGKPASELPLQDRGLAYGDGLFETLLVRNGRPLFLAEHLERLTRGCLVLGLTPDMTALQSEVTRVLAGPCAANAVLKITLTRAAQGRGYRPLTSDCNRILTLHPAPDFHAQAPEQGIAMFLCRQRLARQPVLAGLKHLNRLEQVLASREWPDDSFLEGLMLDTEGWVVEGTRSNVFAVIDGRLVTPELSQCGVAGVLRAVLLQRFGTEAVTGQLTLPELQQAGELFVCNGVNGVWPVTTLQTPDGLWRYQVGPYSLRASQWFREALA